MSKEHAYAYEAGYRDGSINYELEHCPACKNVADLQESLAENEKLREEFNKMDVWHSKELTAAMDENAKLRELVRDVGKAARMFCQAWEGSCSKEAEGMSLHAVCPISDTSELCVFGGLFDRMRELGVEVDA